MRKFLLLRLLSFVALVLLSTSVLSAQATLLVDPADAVYGDLERLAAARLLDHSLLGQRPYSRRRIALAIAHADSVLAHVPPGGKTVAGEEGERVPDGIGVDRRASYETLLARLRADYGWELAQLQPGRDTGVGSAPRWELSAVRQAGADLTAASSPTRVIPRSNGLGEIDASINPLLANRHGRPLVQGGNLLLQTTHSIQSPHVAVGFTPELYLQSPYGSSSRALGNIQELYARALFGNFAVDVGREYQLWGQGRDVGLLNSDNSPGLDLVKLSSDAPFVLPWAFRHLGPTMLSIFYADLGPKQNFPHAYFVGYKGSIAPTSWLELGGTVYTKAGGKGAPTTTFAKRIGDIFPFLQANFFANKFGMKGLYQFSDRYAGLDGRIHLPHAGGAEIYSELLLNDFDVRRLGSVFWEDAGHIAGLDLPRLTGDGSLGLTVEYHHTGIRYYEHEQFLSGQTLRGQLIGDPLGPNAQAGYVTLDMARSVRERLSIGAAVEWRSNDQYIVVTQPYYAFHRTETRPREWRYRVAATWRSIPQRGTVGLLFEGGYERAHNFDFVQSDDRNGLLARAGMEIRFR